MPRSYRGGFSGVLVGLRAAAPRSVFAGTFLSPRAGDRRLAGSPGRGCAGRRDASTRGTGAEGVVVVGPVICGPFFGKSGPWVVPGVRPPVPPSGRRDASTRGSGAGGVADAGPAICGAF